MRLRRGSMWLRHGYMAASCRFKEAEASVQCAFGAVQCGFATVPRQRAAGSKRPRPRFDAPSARFNVASPRLHGSKLPVQRGRGLGSMRLRRSTMWLRHGYMAASCRLNAPMARFNESERHASRFSFSQVHCLLHITTASAHDSRAISEILYE